MRKIFTFILLSLLTITLIGCTKEPKTVPSNLKINDNVLSFNKVSNADSYYVYVGENKFITFENSYALLTLQLATGSYEVTVTAVIMGIESNHSSMIIYEVLPTEATRPLSDRQRLELLQILDISFKFDLKEEDFDDELGYYSYVRAISFVESFDLAATRSDIENDTKMLLFKHIYNNITEISSFESLLTFFDQAITLKLNKEVTSNFMYELLITNYEMNYRMSTSQEYSELLLQYLQTLAEDIEQILASTEYRSIYENIEVLLYEDLVKYYQWPFDYHDVEANILINGIMSGSYFTSRDNFIASISDESLVVRYSAVYDQAIDYINNNELLEYDYILEALNNTLKIYNEIDDVINGFNEFANLDEDEGYINLISNELKLKRAFEDFFTFTQRIRPIASNELIEFFVAIESNQLILNELYRHKNQITSKLLEALPSEEAFANLIYAIEVITQSLTGNNNVADETLVDFAPAVHKSIELIIQTIHNIPSELFTEYSDLVDTLKQEGLSDEEIASVITEQLMTYLVTQIVANIEFESITKDEAQVLFNYVSDFLLQMAISNNLPKEIIDALSNLNELFEPLYYLNTQLESNIFQLIASLEYSTNIYLNIASLEGISKDDYLTLYSELENNNKEILNIIKPHLNDAEFVGSLIDILVFASKLESLVSVYPLNFNLGSNKEHAVAMFSNIVNLIISGYETTENINLEVEMRNYTTLTKHQMLRPLFIRLNMFVNENDLFDQYIKEIKTNLFENFITESSLNLTEAEVDDIILNFDTFIIEFKADVNLIYNFNFEVLTENEKLVIDQFIINYFN